jgi:hypothetical protein
MFFAPLDMFAISLTAALPHFIFGVDRGFFVFWPTIRGRA